jgi:tight adherence protein B
MDPLVALISVLVFVSFVLIFAAVGRAKVEKDTLTARLEAYKLDYEPRRTSDQQAVLRLRQRSYSGFPLLSSFLAQFKGSERVAIELERAGVPLRVGEYYMIRWVLAGLFFLAPLIFGLSFFVLFLSVILGVVGYMLPAMWLRNKKRKRLLRINQQLVDLLGLVSNSLKSGYGLMQSFEFASRQMEPPIALELRRMLREANLGLSAEDALNAMGERIDSKDLDMVLTAINIQRAVGGNLAEILDKVAFTMRERERIRGEIATLTAQQKMTGVVIGGLPVFMFAIFMVLNPDYMSLLFTHFAGRLILATAIVLEILGYLSIRRIMAIEV